MWQVFLKKIVFSTKNIFVWFPHGNNQDKFTVMVRTGHKSPVCYPGLYHDESSTQHEFFAQEVLMTVLCYYRVLISPTYTSL